MIISQLIYWMLWIAVGIWMGLAIINGVQLRNKNKQISKQDLELTYLRTKVNTVERQLQMEIAEKERYQRMAGFYVDLLSYKRNNDIK